MEGFFEELSFWLREDSLNERVFPRELNLHRHIVNNEYEMFNELNEQRFVDGYSSIFSNYQIARRLFDTIFIDIDPPNKEAIVFDQIKTAYNMMHNVLDKLDDAGLKYRIYFSGRGFHIYIDFMPTRLEHYNISVRRLLDNLDVVKYTDSHVLGDIRRVARLPRTINSKTNLHTFRIDKNWDVDTILEYAITGKYSPLPFERAYNKIVNELVDIDNRVEESKPRKRNGEVIFEKWPFDAMPMCIREGILRLKYTGELEHYWRLILALFLLRAIGYEETKKIFEKYAKDYNWKTDYQLRRIMERRYNQYGCDKIRAMGICPYADPKVCPFYPSMNKWLPDWDEVIDNETYSKQ